MKANDGVMSLDIWFLVNFFLFSIAATVLRLHPSIPPSHTKYTPLLKFFLWRMISESNRPVTPLCMGCLIPKTRFRRVVGKNSN